MVISSARRDLQATVPDVKDTDIHASFKDGILTVTVPKVEQKKELPEHNYITIE